MHERRSDAAPFQQLLDAGGAALVEDVVQFGRRFRYALLAEQQYAVHAVSLPAAPAAPLASLARNNALLLIKCSLFCGTNNATQTKRQISRRRMGG